MILVLPLIQVAAVEQVDRWLAVGQGLATLVSPHPDDPLPDERPWHLAGMDGGDLRADWCRLMELRPEAL